MKKLNSVFLLLLILLSCDRKEKDYIANHSLTHINLFYVNLYNKHYYKYLNDYIIEEVNNYHFLSDRYDYSNYLDQDFTLTERLKSITAIYGSFLSFTIIKEDYFYANDYGIYNIAYYLNTEFENCTTKDEIILGYRKKDPQKKIMLAQYTSTVLVWKKK